MKDFRPDSQPMSSEECYLLKRQGRGLKKQGDFQGAGGIHACTTCKSLSQNDETNIYPPSSVSTLDTFPSLSLCSPCPPLQPPKLFLQTIAVIVLSEFDAYSQHSKLPKQEWHPAR